MLVIYDRAIKIFGNQDGGPKIAEETRILVFCITLDPEHIESMGFHHRIAYLSFKNVQ